MSEHVLGLITARGGSKGIPRKNLAPVAGKPLLAYTCEAALGADSLDRVVLSTDDEEIARVGEEHGVDVPFMRPGELATDDASSLDVVLHAVDRLGADAGWHAEWVVVLQPTSPLRRPQDIDAAMERARTLFADTVVSVVRVPHRFSPYSLMKEGEGGTLEHFWDRATPFDRYRRQAHPTLYARNGPAVLCVRVDTLKGTGSFYGGRTFPYEMDEEHSLDIDSRADLRSAERALVARADA